MMNENGTNTNIIQRPRVVITGLGMLTALGHTAAETWHELLAGHSGLSRVTHFDVSPYPCQVAAEIKDFNPTATIPPKEARRMARSSQLAIVTAGQALKDAGLDYPNDEAEDAGVVIGAGLAGMELYTPVIKELGEKNFNRLSPFQAVGGLANMAASHVSQTFGLRATSSTIVTACAAGTQAVGEGAELIRRAAAQVVVAGGVDALVIDFIFGCFSSMRALATKFNEHPQQASRPFDNDRAGFIVGEGAAMLVLERLEHALARGARIYAEVLGHAASSDAYDMAAPEPNGAGAVRAMRRALADAGVKPESVRYINAHGTSTRLNDAIETLAIKRVFGEAAYNIPISSTKSMLGHALGGAGAIEAAVCTLSAADGQIHPTINYETPDPECDLDYVPEGKRQPVGGVPVTLSNSFGLGGQNACLVIGRYQA